MVVLFCFVLFGWNDVLMSKILYVLFTCAQNVFVMFYYCDALSVMVEVTIRSMLNRVSDVCSNQIGEYDTGAVGQVL